MPAHEHVNDVQFNYSTVDMGERRPWHVLVATQENQEIGHMHWTSRGIGNIEVEPKYRRQGLATSMWHEGHRLAAESSGIPQPKHSPERTNQGDKWARSVGGRLPRRKK